MTDPSSPESSSKSSILSNFSLSAAALKAVLRDAAELPSWELCALVDDHREAGRRRARAAPRCPARRRGTSGW